MATKKKLYSSEHSKKYFLQPGKRRSHTQFSYSDNEQRTTNSVAPKRGYPLSFVYSTSLNVTRVSIIKGVPLYRRVAGQRILRSVLKQITYCSSASEVFSTSDSTWHVVANVFTCVKSFKWYGLRDITYDSGIQESYFELKAMQLFQNVIIFVRLADLAYKLIAVDNIQLRSTQSSVHTILLWPTQRTK